SYWLSSHRATCDNPRAPHIPALAQKFSNVSAFDRLRDDFEGIPQVNGWNEIEYGGEVVSCGETIEVYDDYPCTTATSCFPGRNLPGDRPPPLPPSGGSTAGTPCANPSSEACKC